LVDSLDDQRGTSIAGQDQADAWQERSDYHPGFLECGRIQGPVMACLATYHGWVSSGRFVVLMVIVLSFSSMGEKAMVV
jgi:hypothetical protein